MPMSRMILAALLMAAPMLCAQTAGTNKGASAKAETKAAPAQSGKKARQPAHEPLQITINFKRVFRGKLSSDKTYTLAATTNETLPAIRDDARFHASASDEKDYLESNTDVDILALKRSGGSIYLALRISTQTFGMDVPEGLPKLPGVGIHQYILTPTVSIGKQVTVYSSTDALHKTTVEVQLLVQSAGVN
jgi:hypothetical protein